MHDRKDAKPGITRVVTLDRGRTTTVDNLQPGDTVTPIWSKRKGRWKLLIKSANGVRIQHVKAANQQTTEGVTDTGR